jgi:hypothetical protein
MRLYPPVPLLVRAPRLDMRLENEEIRAGTPLYVPVYALRQWSMVSPHVEPVGFHRTADGAIIAEVRQSVRDLEGKPLQGQTHGLRDKTVGHVFRLREGKVARFDIQDAV